MRVAGFGFRKLAPLASLREALALAGGDVALLATAAGKVGGLSELAATLGLAVQGIGPGELARHDRAGSTRVRALYGTGSVAEAAALAAAGPGARIIGARAISRDGMAVVAIAEGPGT